MRTNLSFILFLLFSLHLFAQKQAPKTPAEVVELIKKNCNCTWSDKTVDTFKAGDPYSDLKGIAVCMFADMITLQQAVIKGCNFVITHEPVFYNHLDETTDYADNAVYKEKQKFIKDNGLIVFRFHDHIHKIRPDGISEGMINKMGIKNYAVNEELSLFRIPENTLAGFAAGLKEKLGLKSIRMIGNSDMQFTKLAFMAGAPGGQRHIQMLSNKEVEVLIAGEAPEWETYLYANDAVSQGKNKAVIFLGHIKSEEAGMEYCAEWLQGFIRDVPIHFIENPSNFITF